MRLVNAALISVAVLSLALLALALSPWPSRGTARVTVVAGECATLDAVPDQPNTSGLRDRTCVDR